MTRRTRSGYDGKHTSRYDSTRGTPRHNGLLFGSRIGVAGELLVVIALLASMSVIVITFTNQQEVTNINKASIGVVNNIRDVIARGIIDWLRSDPLPQTLACNGVYELDDIDSLLLQTLRPFIESGIADASFGDDSVQALPGQVASVQFAGLEGVTITLADGSIIYNDSTIYAEDNFDKEYFFNVRLPLALKVVQDWLVCDAGNLSQNLVVYYGPQCFYGKKDPNYPGGCPKKKYTVSQTDRDYILAHSITEEHIAKAATASIEELNRYFSGEETCKAPPLESNAGITCSFEVKDFQAENYMSPYSSEYLPASSSGTLLDANVFDFKKFMTNDEQVYLLPSKVIATPYSDDQLGCAPGDRTPVESSIPSSGLPQETQLIDVATGEWPQGFMASPVLYLNITRGAKFLLTVKCKDEQASLLGQPLEYRFTIKYGVKEHCSPPKMVNGNFMCSGCGLKPGLNFENCVNFGYAWSCDGYERYCNEAMLWGAYVNKSPNFEGLVDACPADKFTGELASTLANCWAHAVANDQYYFFDYLNSTCNTVVGYENTGDPAHSYPKQFLRDENGNLILNDRGQPQRVCANAQVTTCCGTPGYDDANDGACDPANSLSNPSCFMDKNTYVSACTALKSCSRPQFVRGQKCINVKCDPTINECVQDPTDVLYGVKCNGVSGCYKCDDTTGICGYDSDMTGERCTERWPEDCKKYACVPVGDDGACQGSADPTQEGRSCGEEYQDSCSSYTCTAGSCLGTPVPPGTPCGEDTYVNECGARCTTQKTCTLSSDGQHSICSPGTTSCAQCPTGGGGCGAGFCPGGDGRCNPCG